MGFAGSLLQLQRRRNSGIVFSFAQIESPSQNWERSLTNELQVRRSIFNCNHALTARKSAPLLASQRLGCSLFPAANNLYFPSPLNLVRGINPKRLSSQSHGTRSSYSCRKTVHTLAEDRAKWPTFFPARSSMRLHNYGVKFNERVHLLGSSTPNSIEGRGGFL